MDSSFSSFHSVVSILDRGTTESSSVEVTYGSQGGAYTFESSTGKYERCSILINFTTDEHKPHTVFLRSHFMAIKRVNLAG